MKYYIILLAIAICGCKGSSSSYETIIKESIGTHIKFSDNIELHYNEADSVKNQFMSKQFKIINYIDTNGCMECRLHLFDWGELQRKLDTLCPNTTVAFVVWSNDYPQIEKLAKIHRFKSPMWYDKNGEFSKINKLPTIGEYTTFLLDQNNNIVLVGSPVDKYAVLELYISTIKQLSNSK